MRWCAEDLGWVAALAAQDSYSTAELYCQSLPVGGGAGLRQCSALKAIEVVY